jgi:hypothetical protein
VQYKPFAVLSTMGNVLLIVVAILAITALIVPMIKRVKNTSDNRLVIHDLPPETIENLFPDSTNTKFFCAARKMAHCKGFYACWLKNPGICAIYDGVERLGNEIAKCHSLVIISKSLYGGLDIHVKNVLDRSVSFGLPFFQVREKELHHQLRYEHEGAMQAYIYNAAGLPQEEKDAISDVIRAIGLNLDKHGCQTIFLGDIQELSEVLK